MGDRAAIPEVPSTATAAAAGAVPEPRDPSSRTHPARSELVETKLAVPSLPPGVVPRPRLLELMDAGAPRRVTVLSAGPGWGKTLLAAQWAATPGTSESSGTVAWWTLDRHDNDPITFWSYLLAALQTTQQLPTSLERLAVRAPLGQDLQRRIISGLVQLEKPVTLVLDDFGEITDAGVLDGIDDLLRHPSKLHLVLLTRSDAHLRLHRLRLDGQLTDIRAADLAFTEDEADELLHASGVDLQRQLRHQLFERTEGWAAGIRLAAIFASGPGPAERIADFAGDEGSVAEYLLEEVLGRLSEERRQFLLRTSIVDRVCGDLADALCETSDGQRELETLERANAFVVTLGAGHRWFRYHPLMRDLLRHRLRLDDPSLLTSLHRTAARWFEQRNEPIEAIHHALRAEDWQFVGDMITRGAGALAVSAQRQTFAALLAEIPADALGSSPELRICGAVRCFFVQDYAGMANHVAMARSMLSRGEAAVPEYVEVFLSVTDMVLARLRGDMAGLMSTTEEMLKHVEDPARGGLPARQFEGPALGNMGVGLLWTGDRNAAEQRLLAALGVAREQSTELVVVNSLGYLSLVELGRGHLSRASDLATEAIQIADERGWNELTQANAGRLALGLVALERGQLDQAQRHLDAGLAVCRNDPERVPRLAHAALQARLELMQGHVKQSRQSAAWARTESRGHDTPRLLDQLLTLVEAELDLSGGHASAALERLRPLTQGEGGLEDLLTACMARAHVSRGDFTSAATTARPLVEDATSLVARVEAWLVLALVADHDRDDHEALACLDRALVIATAEQIRRPFVAPMHERLHTLMLHRQRLEAESDFLDDVLEVLDGNVRSGPVRPLRQPLTDRERIVLTHIATMQTNEEIADELFVSINTIKAHARSVYRKLEVTNRRAAVTRARELGLL
jgi:LuxR family maltose regulon positive regulatory protein